MSKKKELPPLTPHELERQSREFSAGWTAFTGRSIDPMPLDCNAPLPVTNLPAPALPLPAPALPLPAPDLKGYFQRKREEQDFHRNLLALTRRTTVDFGTQPDHSIRSGWLLRLTLNQEGMINRFDLLLNANRSKDEPTETGCKGCKTCNQPKCE